MLHSVAVELAASSLQTPIRCLYLLWIPFSFLEMSTSLLDGFLETSRYNCGGVKSWGDIGEWQVIE